MRKPPELWLVNDHHPEFRRTAKFLEACGETVRQTKVLKTWITCFTHNSTDTAQATMFVEVKDPHPFEVSVLCSVMKHVVARQGSSLCRKLKWKFTGVVESDVFSETPGRLPRDLTFLYPVVAWKHQRQAYEMTVTTKKKGKYRRECFLIPKRWTEPETSVVSVPQSSWWGSWWKKLTGPAA